MSQRASSAIHFHYQADSFNFPDRTKLKTFLHSLFSTEKTRLADLSFVFCTDEFLLQINRAHLKHDFYTDIVTFPLSAAVEPIVAEIYISVDRVRDNATAFNTSFLNELHRVIFHGCLHLAGYMDKDKASRALMRKREDFYLRKYFVSRGTGR